MKNFVLLFIITGCLGLFLKIYFHSNESYIVDGGAISLNENKIDSLFYRDALENQNKKYFNEFKVYNFNLLENILTDAIYDSAAPRQYAMGNLHFKRYFEFIAARDFLFELNNNLYNQPALDRFYGLPLFSNQEFNNLFDEYGDLVRSTYGLDKSYSDLSNTKPPRLFSISEYTIYNPKLFDYYAKLSLDKAIYNLNKYLNSEGVSEDRRISCLLKLSILYAKSDNKIELQKTYDQTLSVTFLTNLLNTFDDQSYIVDFLDIEVIDLMVELELYNILDLKDSEKIYKIVEDRELRLLYLLKRKLAGLRVIDDSFILYNCEKIENIFYAPEIIASLAELNFKNNEIALSEDIITSFWFNCTKDKQDWIYNNYPSLLLKFMRMGHWHGAKIPSWYQYFRDHYVQVPDQYFNDLNATFKTWVVSTIGGIGGADEGRE